MDTVHKMVICLNGHMITDNEDIDAITTGFCPTCGEKLISKCPICKNYIPGETTSDDFVFVGFPSEPVPNYCAHCGNAYPWTKRAIDSAKELINFSKKLNDKEKQQLAESIPDLISDTPRTKIAIVKFKLLSKKAGSTIASGLHDILVDVVSETVKKTLFGY